MNALTCLRIQAISLAILLAIIDRTHGFTLRYNYVRPTDMDAEESYISEVRHELKRDTEENEHFKVSPIATALQFAITTEATDSETDKIRLENNVTTKGTTQLLPSFNATELNETIVEGSTNITDENQEVNVSLARKVRQEITTPLLTLQEETSTFGITNTSIPRSNEIDKNDSTVIISFTTVSPKIGETPTEKHNIEETPTEQNSTGNITTQSKNYIADTVVTTKFCWKKYTKIDRKPIQVSEVVIPLRNERVGDSINAHTTESRVSLEKAFDLAPDILSLQELKTHLLENTNSIPTTVLTDVNPTEIVSMRAGYLNHTNPQTESPITTTVKTPKFLNEIEIAGAAYEELHEDNEYAQNKTSHSQLVEDAWKEELLVEDRLKDNIRFSSIPKKNDTLNEITPSPETKLESGDYLTVKPINKNKLYTVSPNYKPLKKIEVQPSKPFMRDPDDNSWRNESLSSLGIVFKGKNSSKAFTEVLKNKTENIMSLPEQEKVFEKVELRDRLEKIAEKRKSRKKKVDRYGNTEYGDYEENNSSDMHSSKEKPSGASETPPTLPGLVSTGISKDTMFKDAPVSTEPSGKPKVKFTIPDYLDSGKDDEVDYVSYPNIDILKSTPRPRVQWPVTQKILDNTQPIRPYLPDRTPTVQYFPPLPKSPENDNDNFKHKFSLFGHTAHQPAVGPGETYTEKTNPETDEYHESEDINKRPNQHPNLAIQHVEYRPVGSTDETFMMRHYKDLLESVAKEADYDRNGPYPSQLSNEGKTVKSEELDYGQRKEGINRFVDYFNQNHDRFKADFPVIFNTSVIHGSESGKVLASSSAMFKRLYNGPLQEKEVFSFSNKPYDPNCDNITVELSPAYELHYYVPEQEETGTRSEHSLGYGYRST